MAEQDAYLYRLVRQMRADIEAMQRSHFWRLRARWFALTGRLWFGKRDTLRHYDAETDAELFGPIGDPYAIWIDHHHLREDDAADLAATVAFLPLQATFGLFVPGEPGSRLLEATRASLARQLYPHWELSVGNVPPPADFIARLEPGDILEPDALYRCAFTANATPTANVIYSDVDFLEASGRRVDPYFKPDWAPESALGRNLFVGLTCLRASALERVGALGTAGSAQWWYDAALRVAEDWGTVVHVPRVLVHRGSEPAHDLAAPELRVVEAALARRAIDATVEPVGAGRIPYRLVRYRVPAEARASIVIPTRDRADLLAPCLESIFGRSTFARFEVVVIDNGSAQPATAKLLGEYVERFPDRFRVLTDPRPFNYAALNNAAVATCTSEAIVFLNNDTTVISPDWLESLLGYALRPEIGAVGALLLYPDDTVQHAGVVMSVVGMAAHAHRDGAGDVDGYYGALRAVTNYAAVTGACLAIERTKFLAAGGFDERFAIAWNDVDLCLRLLDQGYRNVCVPARLYHYESKSRGLDNTAAKIERAEHEVALMRQRWPRYCTSDPYYSPHLTRDAEDFGVRFE